MKTKDARIAFFGTPNLAVYILEELHDAGIVPMVVVTQPDRPAGRKLLLTPPPVKEWALKHDIAVFQPESFIHRSDAEEFANSEWDLCILAAFNTILPRWVLELPTRGFLNVHPSLLPKLRGPSPLRSAILRDEKDAVGVSIIKLDEEMDHGPLVAQANFELPVWPDKGEVLDEILFREGGRLLAEVIPEWLEGAITPVAQEHEKATYTKKFKKADGEIVLSDDDYENYRKFCAHDGWPGTFFFADYKGKKIRVKVTDATYEGDVFTLLKVIPEGKNEISYVEWQRMLVQ
jgi:methionyl-tRNA formyltransferase